MRLIEVHVDQVVLYGRNDLAAVERSIVDSVGRALEERGLDASLVAVSGVQDLHARAQDPSAGAVGSGVARALTQGTIA